MSQASSRQSLWQRFKFAIPNLMTLTRLLLIYPYIVFLQSGERTLAAVTYIIALITDMDGTVARKIGATSKFGSLFDPTVDIIFNITAFVFLVKYDSMLAWAVIAYLVTVVLKFTYMQYYFRKNKRVKSSIISKTVANSATVGAIVATFGAPIWIPTAFMLVAIVGNVYLTGYWWLKKRATD